MALLEWKGLKLTVQTKNGNIVYCVKSNKGGCGGKMLVSESGVTIFRGADKFDIQEKAKDFFKYYV